MSEIVRVAYGDESVRVIADPPVYLMAATVLSDDDGLRRLESVKPRSADKLHWRDMTDRAKRQSVAAVETLEQASVIVAAAPLPKKKQERARRKCLEALLFELEQRGVRMLVLEARTRDRNAKDVELLLSMRAKGLAGDIDLRHTRGGEEPRLWIPDQILGAYGDVLCKSRGFEKWQSEWESIARRVTVLDVRL